MSKATLKLHAVVLALNEEVFLKPLLDTIYGHCSGISVVSQYDRDWYGKPVRPDRSLEILSAYLDPQGKINIVIRRSPDEAAARNMEMLSFDDRSFRSVMSHGNSIEKIREFHDAPDYFWIIDADEMYDSATIGSITSYIAHKQPRGMRVTGYNYLRSWNQRVPREQIDFTHFGFIRPGVLFEQRRVVSWNESRLRKLFRLLHMPDLSARIYGFINCPESVGVFHHGCWLGDDERIRAKFSKSSHIESQQWQPKSVDDFKTIYVPTNQLPENIRSAKWPQGFLDATK